MFRSKEMLPVNIAVLALFLAAVAVSLTLNRVQTINRSVPHFIYQEIKVERTAPAAVRKELVKRAARPLESAFTDQPPLIKTVPPLIPPKVVSRVAPAYPQVAIEHGVEGLVRVEVLVSKNGESDNIKVLGSSGNQFLDKAALFAVSQWEFRPALQGEAAVASWFEIPIAFKLK